MNRLAILLLTGTLHASVVDDLQKFEGLRLQAYLDTTGHYTCGYGRRCEKGARIDQDQAMAMLHDDITLAEKGARRVFVTYDNQPQHVRDVLVELCFQLGATGASKFIKFKAAIAANDYRLAASEMLNSKWAKQTPARVTELANRIKQGTP